MTTTLLSQIEELKKAVERDFAEDILASWQAHLREYNRLILEGSSSGVSVSANPVGPLPRRALGDPEAAKAKLSELLHRVSAFAAEVREAEGEATLISAENTNDAFNALVKIANAFPRAVVGMNERTSEIVDESGVQQLLHGLLLTEFADVRREEPTASSAGRYARADFFLKDSGILIETKFVHARQRASRLGDELMIDIGRYRSHGQAIGLFCFVYDPRLHLPNPAGFVADLENLSVPNFPVRVVVAPSGQ